MLDLLLLRHAKSSWAEANQPDIDRPLNARGRKAASLIGGALVSRNLLPGLVLCSPAQRTRETWAIAAHEFPSRPPLKIVDELYDFGDGSALLKAIITHGAAATPLLLIAHNPAIQHLALSLTSGDSSKLRRRMDEK